MSTTKLKGVNEKNYSLNTEIVCRSVKANQSTKALSRETSTDKLRALIYFQGLQTGYQTLG